MAGEHVGDMILIVGENSEFSSFMVPRSSTTQREVQRVEQDLVEQRFCSWKRFTRETAPKKDSEREGEDDLSVDVCCLRTMVRVAGRTMAGCGPIVAK